MMNNNEDHLINAFLNDALTSEEALAFADLIRESDQARLRFWELAEIHGLTQDAARLAWPDSSLSINQEWECTARSSSTLAWFKFPQWSVWDNVKGIGVLAVLLAGIICGALSSSLAWAWAASQPERAKVLLRESFETGPAPLSLGVPDQPGIWSGDQCGNVADFGSVKPAAGQCMLRFIAADYDGKPLPGGSISEVYYLLDCRQYRHEFRDGSTVVCASARFNALDYPIDEIFSSGISIYALDSHMATSGATRDPVKLVEDSLATTRRSKQQLDRDVATWQESQVEMRVPPETEYLLLRIAVGRPPSRGPEDTVIFPGQFADDIRVSLIRRPAAP